MIQNIGMPNPVHLDLILLKIFLIFNMGGIVSPNKNPHGFKGSI